MSIDKLNRYLFEEMNVRGELVQLNDSYQQILATRAYPKALQKLLGELMSASALLTATLKFSGDIAVQIQGDGPVSVAVINGNDKQQLRGLARWNGDIADDADLQQMFGKGHLVITLTPENGERYQGVVELSKDSLAASIEAYFMQSEQLPTKLWLFADGQRAGGIFLQVLPSESGELNDFEHLEQLTATIKKEEVLTLPATELLHRLYHQEQVRLFDADDISFHCRCSRERTAAAILSLTKEEVDSIIAEQGNIELDCEYCNTKYSFDSIDVAGIFAHAQPNETIQ
ncbi:MAG: Hsp33 family molecular chaperone HslO [Parashewanella sp.]